MRDLDAIARRLHQAVKDLTPAPAALKAPAAATPAPVPAAPVAVEPAPADRPQHATFYRDDTGRALHVDVQFQKGVVRITPGFDDDGLMAYADFAAIAD